MSSNKPNPLPLGDVLRDLAVLRASDVDLSDGTTFPDAESTDSANEADGPQKSVQQSYEFVKEAREVLKVHQRGDLDKQVDKLGVLRSKLEELRGGARDDNNQGPKVGRSFGSAPYAWVADLLRNFSRS